MAARMAAELRMGLAVGLIALTSSAYGPDVCSAQADLEISLRPDLVIGEGTGVSFGGSLKVAVAGSGLIYVADPMNLHIQVFRPDGSLREAIGRPGGGPGEFRAIHSITIGRNDSLYVYDANAFRLTVYGPGEEHSLAYTVPVSTGSIPGHPYRFFVPTDPELGFFFAFRQQSTGTIRVHQVDSEGRANPDPVLEERASESMARVAGSGTSVTRTSPLFGRQAMVGLTSDQRLYYGWSEKVDLTFYDLTGQWVGIFRADVPPVPVTERDIAYEMKGASEMRRRALAGAEHPETKPAVHTVIIDDRSWIWTGRYTPDPEVSEWWVTHDAGEKSSIFSLPADMELQVARDGYAYAVGMDEVGFPAVFRYAIEVEGGGS